MPAIQETSQSREINFPTASLDAYYGLPREVRFCNRCVISNQRPDSTVEFKNDNRTKQTIVFDEEGICAACRYAEIKDREIDWREREEKLITLCNEHRSRGGVYDCIVPGSGGKDSFFAAHVLKYKYGMHPLTVTWAPHLYTQVGFHNFQEWIHAGFDNLLLTPNGKIHRLLTRLAFERLVHPFQPFIVGQRHIAAKMSTTYGIPLVFYGENPAEYGHRIEENFTPTMSATFYTGDRGKRDLLLSGCSIEELERSHGLTVRDLEPYLPADAELTKNVGTTVHFLGFYLKWDPQECYYYARQNCKFLVNDERTEGTYSKYNSIDDRTDPFHYFTTYIKFGIGRATYDASQEIRNRKITREEGVALVKRFDHEFPHRYFREFLEYMDVSEERFWEVIDAARSPHLWAREDGEWRLRHPIWIQGV